jgi:hypothetical protein
MSCERARVSLETMAFSQRFHIVVATTSDWEVVMSGLELDPELFATKSGVGSEMASPTTR